TRSMPWRLAVLPRRMLPPPITTATSTPSLWISLTCSAILSTVSGQMPESPSLALDSPENLIKILRYLGFSIRLSHSEARKTADRDVLAEFGHFLGDEVLDLQGVVLDIGLLQETGLLVKLGELTLHDLFDDVLRLFGGRGLRPVDGFFLLEHVLRHFLAADVERVGRRDLHGHLVRELLEIVRARHEIGLAVELEQDADLAAHVDVGLDQALLGGAG